MIKKTKYFFIKNFLLILVDYNLLIKQQSKKKLLLKPQLNKNFEANPAKR